MQSTPFNVGEFLELHGLCNRHTDSFAAIGEQFSAMARSRDPSSICLTLIAMYQEHVSIIHVTQRLILVYLIYRLRDIGIFANTQSEETNILCHPFLMLIVRIYIGFISPTPTKGDSNDSVLYRLRDFPSVTPQEGHFVGRLLTASTSDLRQLFELSPSEVADNPIHEKQVSNSYCTACTNVPYLPVLDVTSHVAAAEAQLEPYRLLGKEGAQDNACDGKGAMFMPESDATLYSIQARVVYSLSPAPFIRIEPSVMPPCEDEFHFIYASLIEPEQVRDDWVKDEEWTQEKMRSLDKTLEDIKMTSRGSTPSSPRLLRKDGPPMAVPSLTAVNGRTQTAECLKKIIAGFGSSLGKTDVARVVAALAEDRDIFKEVDIAVGDFPKFLESQPDIAAELLLYELTSAQDILSIHLEVILSVDLSVQSLVTVNKFVSTCEAKGFAIPEDFLNRFITFCMNSCENENRSQNLVNRLVRLVCVFFSTLIRLKSFDVKPRFSEMQNFTTMFSSVKEAMLLYQSILSILQAK
jgi:hypothetical protein